MLARMLVLGLGSSPVGSYQSDLAGHLQLACQQQQHNHALTAHGLRAQALCLHVSHQAQAALQLLSIQQRPQH